MARRAALGARIPDGRFQVANLRVGTGVLLPLPARHGRPCQPRRRGRLRGPRGVPAAMSRALCFVTSCLHRSAPSSLSNSIAPRLDHSMTASSVGPSLVGCEVPRGLGSSPSPLPSFVCPRVRFSPALPSLRGAQDSAFGAPPPCHAIRRAERRTEIVSAVGPAAGHPGRVEGEFPAGRPHRPSAPNRHPEAAPHRRPEAPERSYRTARFFPGRSGKGRNRRPIVG